MSRRSPLRLVIGSILAPKISPYQCVSTDWLCVVRLTLVLLLLLMVVVAAAVVGGGGTLESVAAVFVEEDNDADADDDADDDDDAANDEEAAEEEEQDATCEWKSSSGEGAGHPLATYRSRRGSIRLAICDTGKAAEQTHESNDASSRRNVDGYARTRTRGARAKGCGSVKEDGSGLTYSGGGASGFGAADVSAPRLLLSLLKILVRKDDKVNSFFLSFSFSFSFSFCFCFSFSFMLPDVVEEPGFTVDGTSPAVAAAPRVAAITEACALRRTLSSSAYTSAARWYRLQPRNRPGPSAPSASVSVYV